MLAEGIDPLQAKKDQQAKANLRSITLRQLADEFRESKRNRLGKPLSESYKTEVKRYVNLADFADKPIVEITPQDISVWFNGLSKRTGNQASKAYSWIKSVMFEAIDREIIVKNPCRIKGAGTFTSSIELPIPSVEQVRIMYEHAKGDYLAVLALEAGGGLRRGEVMELRLKNVQVENQGGRQVVYIDIKKAMKWTKGGVGIVVDTKTPGSVRRIPLDPVDGKIIQNHLASMNAIDPEALLFTSNRATNKYWAEHHSYNYLKKLFAIAGWDGSPHRLRAYAATQFGLTGASAIEIMERFGHRSIKTAMKYQRSTGREVELLDRLAR